MQSIYLALCGWPPGAPTVQRQAAEHCAPAQVADFNLSRIFEPDEEDAAAEQTRTTARMNPRWLAPELLQGEKATRASDVYAFGEASRRYAAGPGCGPGRVAG